MDMEIISFLSGIIGLVLMITFFVVLFAIKNTLKDILAELREANGKKVARQSVYGKH